MSKKLKQNWRKYVNQLNEPNYSCFKELKEYMDCSDSMYEHKDECLEEILDLMISAQQDGVPIESVIGSDRQAFCENILQSINVTNKAQRIILRICGWGITAVVMGLLELVIAYTDASFGWGKGGKINILYPFLIATLILALDWGMEVLIRRQLVKQNNDTLYKKRGGIKVVIWIISGFIGAMLRETISYFGVEYEWLFVSVVGLLLMGGAIVLFSIICYMLLSSGLDSKQSGRLINAESRTKSIVEKLEMRYHNKISKLEKVGQFIENNKSRDEFQRKYLRECKVTHYLFLFDFIATLGLLFFVIQMENHEIIPMLAVVIIMIIVSGYGFSLEHKQKEYIATWRRMK